MAAGGAGELRSMYAFFGFDVDDATLQRLDTSMDRARGEMQRTAAAGDGIGASLRRAALQYVGLEAMLRAGRGVVTTIAEYQTLEARLETVTGSAEAARVAFAGLEDFGTSTPFTLNKVTDAYIRLLNAGIDPTEARLTGFGDIAASNGADIVDFADATVGAITGEMERLKQFGIIARQHGDEVTFTFRGVSTTVGKNTEEIVGYLDQLGATNFAGGMERQMQTLGGRWSNFVDNLAKWANKIGDAGVTEGITDLLSTMTGITAEGEGVANVLGRVIGGAATRLAATLRWLADNSAMVKTALVGLGGFMVLQRIQAAIGAIQAMGTAGLVANAKLMAIPVAIALLFLVVEDFVGFLQGKDSVIGAFVDRFAEAPGPIGAVARALKDMREYGHAALVLFAEDIESTLDTVEAAFRWWGQKFENIGNAVLDMWDRIRTAIADGRDAIAGVLGVGSDIAGFARHIPGFGAAANFMEAGLDRTERRFETDRDAGGRGPGAASDSPVPGTRESRLSADHYLPRVTPGSPVHPSQTFEAITVQVQMEQRPSDTSTAVAAGVQRGTEELERQLRSSRRIYSTEEI